MLCPVIFFVGFLLNHVLEKKIQYIMLQAR